MKNIKRIAAAAAFAGVFMLSVAEVRQIKITDNYLTFPVSHKCDRVRINISGEGLDLLPVDMRLTDGQADYVTFKDVSALKGRKITVSAPDGFKGLDAIGQSSEIPGNDTVYKELNRPQYHFTTRRGWINDPNGLIYHDGEYHLFYQHNPYERDWGNMHWGHAVSRDLVHWTELAPALYPDTMGAMFSGSAVIDTNNDSGFGTKDNPAMVAAFTVDNPDRQMQCIAYSLDNGRTFTKYSGNPVIDSKEKWDSHDTRDPKMFRYGDRWVLVLNERDGHSIYNSNNLRDWTFKSHITGFWECPELFELPVDGDKNNTMWVMYGASGTYMLGDFDGEKFTPTSGKHYYSTGSIYAAQTINNMPASDGRRIQIGWGRISHRGMDFNGMMLIPTELSLRTTKDGVRLVSKPVREIEELCVPAGSWTNLTQEKAAEVLAPFAKEGSLHIRATFSLSHATDAVLRLGKHRLFDYNMNSNTVNGVFYSPQDPTSTEITADIYLDRTSAEVFVDGGLYSYSMGRTVPLGDEARFRLDGNRVTVKSLEVFTIPSVWQK